VLLIEILIVKKIVDIYNMLSNAKLLSISQQMNSIQDETILRHSLL